MIATWLIEMKTGYDLTDNDRYRIRELLSEAIHDTGESYMATVKIITSHFIPGPVKP